MSDLAALVAELAAKEAELCETNRELAQTRGAIEQCRSELRERDRVREQLASTKAAVEQQRRTQRRADAELDQLTRQMGGRPQTLSKVRELGTGQREPPQEAWSGESVVVSSPGPAAREGGDYLLRRADGWRKAGHRCREPEPLPRYGERSHLPKDRKYWQTASMLGSGNVRMATRVVSKMSMSSLSSMMRDAHHSSVGLL